MHSFHASTKILNQKVFDLEDFSNNHGKYLVDIYANPDEAAQLVRNQLSETGLAEGFVQIEYKSQKLFNPTLWDEVSGIWFILVDIAEQFVTAEDHVDLMIEHYFPDQPVPITLSRRQNKAHLTIDESTFRIDSENFFQDIIESAKKYFLWMETYAETHETEILNRIRTLQQ